LFERIKKIFAMNDEGNAVLYGAAVLIAVVILIALGGLLANAFTQASALPVGNAFNVSSTTSTNYAQDVNILYVAVLALIGLPVLGMLLAYFGFGIGKAGSQR
jgi:hypothetical protein